MHEDVAAVMEELDGHRVRFEALCRSLSAEELDRPVPGSTWLVRDFIAHLATIDGPITDLFERLHAGQDPGLRTADGARWDVDRFNEEQIQARRGRTVDELLIEAAVARARLRHVMGGLGDEALCRTLKFGGDAKRPPAAIELRRYLRGWCKHDAMHALDMTRVLPERITPELEHWFADPIVQGYQRAMNG